MLTAEITGRIGKVPKLVGGKRQVPVAVGGRLLACRRGEAVVARRAGLPPALLSAFTAVAAHRRPVLLVCKSLSGSRSLRLPSSKRLGWWRGVLVVFSVVCLCVPSTECVFLLLTQQSQDSSPCTSVQAASCFMKCVENNLREYYLLVSCKDQPFPSDLLWGRAKLCQRN